MSMEKLQGATPPADIQDGGDPYDLDIYPSSDMQHNLGELPGSTTL